MNHFSKPFEFTEISTFNSLLGFSSFESVIDKYMIHVRQIPFNSLLGFSSFESLALLLQLTALRFQTFNSLLGFSSFESILFDRGGVLLFLSFNSLLGFSSFESHIEERLDQITPILFQFPIGIF